MTSQKGKLIVITAPSGAGKTTLINRLMTEIPELRFSISATTRSPRDNEKNGVHYYFITKEEFMKKAAAGEFLEWEEFYAGTCYGTLRSEVDKNLKSGYFVLLDLEVKGAVNVKHLYGGNCLSIFIQPPSLQQLRQRLMKRGTENDKSLTLRLERAEEELTYADRFDRIIINDDLETAYIELKQAVSKFLNLTYT